MGSDIRRSVLAGGQDWVVVTYPSRFAKGGHSYEELTDQLQLVGFEFCPDSFCWKHPVSGVTAAAEALDDICKMWPALTGQVLRILCSGDDVIFSIELAQDGLGATVKLQPQFLLDRIAAEL